MTGQSEKMSRYTVEELERELIARSTSIKNKERFAYDPDNGNPNAETILKNALASNKTLPHISRNPNLQSLDIYELAEELMRLTGYRERKGWRGIWEHDDRKDFHDIADDQARENARCVAAICLKNDLDNEDSRDTTRRLKTKKFGKAFSLCETEAFYHQPIANGRMSTGFLVQPDVIATAAHCIKGHKITDLRFLFDYKVTDPLNVVHAEQVPNESIYKGVEVIQYNYDPDNVSDWALVRLDHEVEGHPVVTLAQSPVLPNQPVYVIGHPCGLPLKYASGANIQNVEKTHFVADLDVFAGNSGSPVFSRQSHEVIGIVVHGDSRNFMSTSKGWITVVFPNSQYHSDKAHCTRTSEFIQHLRESREKQP